MVSGTIQLPSELYWISPTFQNKETNFSESPSGSQRKNHIIFSRQPRSLYPLPAPLFKESSRITLSTVEILLLKLCIFKYQVKLQKDILFFSTAFFYTLKKKSSV